LSPEVQHPMANSPYKQYGASAVAAYPRYWPSMKTYTGR
jgi:hypothetical protein